MPDDCRCRRVNAAVSMPVARACICLTPKIAVALVSGEGDLRAQCHMWALRRSCRPCRSRESRRLRSRRSRAMPSRLAGGAQAMMLKIGEQRRRRASSQGRRRPLRCRSVRSLRLPTSGSEIGVPDLREEEDRAHERRRETELHRGVLHVHDQDQHVAVNHGRCGHAISEERSVCQPIPVLHAASRGRARRRGPRE